MFRKQTRSWVSVALALALFSTAGAGRAAALPWQDQLASAWEGLWARAAIWLGGAPATDLNGQTKTCSSINPDGQPVCSAGAAGIRPYGRPTPSAPGNGQAKTCSSIDPLGRPVCSSTSSMIEPLGQPH